MSPRRGIYHPKKKAIFPKDAVRPVGRGVLDRGAGLHFHPHTWLQRQEAAGLCIPTPGREVKPQESSKQVEA